MLLAHKKKALRFRMSDTVSLFSLFISSFLAATLLPGGSEAALFAVLKAYPETLWVALVIAIVGINSMKKAEEAAATPAAPPAQEILLTEIRDLLKK